jgi:hypothetical protein
MQKKDVNFCTSSFIYAINANDNVLVVPEMGFQFTEHKIMIMLDQLRHKDTVILISYTKKLSLVVK